MTYTEYPDDEYDELPDYLTLSQGDEDDGDGGEEPSYMYDVDFDTPIVEEE